MMAVERSGPAGRAVTAADPAGAAATRPVSVPEPMPDPRPDPMPEPLRAADPARPRVKICGVTRVEDALLAAELGADLIGLNFYPRSPRCVGVHEAERIAAAVAGQVGVVGVFVNAPRAELEEIRRRVPLDYLQFHGDERPDDVEPFGGRALKVFRVRERFAAAELAAYPRAGGFLFDGAHHSLYGGAGASWPWEWIAGLGAAKPCFVAGGIRPESVREALERSGADGVDVCSGVEASPGIKDPDRMQKLLREVRHVRQES